LTDKRRAWAVLIVVFVSSIAVSANRFKVPPVLPILMDEFRVDMVTGGWMMSLSSVAGVILAIPAAFLLTRIGLKFTGLFALGCALAGAVAGALAASAAALLLSRVIEGASVSLMAVAAPTAISLWFPPRERGLPMGIWAAWVPVGNVLMFNLAHPLMNAAGWQAVWWFGALLAFVCLVLFGLVVTSPTESQSPGSTAPVPSSSFGRMLFNPSAWLLALAFGIFGFCLIGYNTWTPAFLTDTLGVDLAAASAYASLMFLAAIPASVIAGWVISRLKDRYCLLLVAFLITSALFFWSFRLEGVSTVVLYILVLGFVSSFIPTATFTLAPETMPTLAYASLGLAIVMAASNLGALAGPPALAAILTTANWSAGSVFLAFVSGFGTIVAWHALKRLRAARQTASTLSR
jgi:MFS family permease